MRNLKKLERLHIKISQLENNGRFIESKKLHNEFVKEAAIPVAQPYPYAYPVYPQYQQYPIQYQQYPVQYPQYPQYPVQPAAYPVMQQQRPVQTQPLQQQPTRPQVPTPQTTTQPPAGQPNIQPNAFYYDNNTKQHYFKGKPVSQMSDTEIKKMQEEMFKK